MLFSLAIHPAVKIRRLNLLLAVANYSAMSSVDYQKFDNFDSNIQTKLFLQESGAL